MLLQSFEDEFKRKAGKVMVLAEAGGILVKRGERDKALSKGEKAHYRIGVRKVLHIMCWSRP